MKIVIVGTAYPYRGGLAAFNERLARQLMDEGHEVEVWTFTLQYPSFLFPGKTQYSNGPAPQGLTIRRRFSSINPFSWIRAGRELRKMAPDMVVCCYWMSFMAPCFGTIERIAKRNGHTRCIALVHNILPHEPSLLDKILTPYFIRYTDGYVALSQAVVDDIERFDPAGRPKTCSPHPIYDHYGPRLSKQESCAALGLETGYKYMLFFGLVRAYKGLDWLLEAFGRIHERLPQLRLLVVGEFYEQEDKYRQQIAALGLQDKVIVHNEFVPDEQLPYWFGAADLIVQPYKTATQSGVTQVAFHFEKPMLVTNVGGLGEIVHDGKMGYATEPQPEAIAAAIEDYFTNDRQGAFTTYLKREKKKYGWDKMTQAFQRMWDAAGATCSGVHVRNLNKHIGKQHILHDVNIDIAKGEVVGLLGENGAGKSTLMKILTGIWEPDSQESRVKNKELRAKSRELSVQVPERIGYLPENNPLYEQMYVREYLQLMRRITGAQDDIENLIERVGLTPEADKRIGQLSKGYRQRVGLAQAIMGDPQLLILDEPTTGLDPNQLIPIRALIRELGRDRTVILSTHILQEVKEMCNRVIIIHHGRIVADTHDVDALDQLFEQTTYGK